MLPLSLGQVMALAVLSLPWTTSAAPSPPSIAMSPGLPSTSSLDPNSDLVLTWDAAFPSLTKRARALTVGFLNRQAAAHRSMAGVPGTAISSDAEARLLQEHLDCSVGRGQWVYEPEGGERERSGSAGLSVHKQESIHASCDKKFFKSQPANEGDSVEWNVRESLKWRFVPSDECLLSAPEGVPPAKVSRKELCELLAHKAITIAGDTPQFGLHDLLLDWTSLRPQSCYGDLYCKEHELCEDVLAADRSEVDNWSTDERVYDQLPFPQRHLQFKREFEEEQEASGADDAPREDEERASDSASPPTTLEKRARWSSPSVNTLLRYRRTDGLRYASGVLEPTYANPATGVREINQMWLPDSRRSDLVIISKAPLPLPIKGINSTWDSWWAEGLALGGGAPSAQRVLEAAWRMTEDHWLPELIEALKAARGPGSPVEQLIVFRGGWRSHADCAAESLLDGDESAVEDWPTSPGDGPPPHKKQPSLASILFRAIGEGSLGPNDPLPLQNVHALFFNLQTILQNEIARKVVLPQFGIPYLDMETPLSIWRSGMVGGSAAASFSRRRDSSPFSLVDQSKPSGRSIGLRSAASGDCTRYCFPGPGMAMEEAFIGGLVRLMKRAWAGTDERRREWVGDGYRSLAAREKARGRG